MTVALLKGGALIKRQSGVVTRPPPTLGYEMNEDELQELLEFATGKGKFAWTGPYMHTHPEMDENQDGLHAGCVELEKRGLLKRLIDEPGHVSWIDASNGFNGGRQDEDSSVDKKRA